MNNTLYLQQISQIGNRDSSLITRHYRLDLMARFIENLWKQNLSTQY